MGRVTLALRLVHEERVSARDGRENHQAMSGD